MEPKSLTAEIVSRPSHIKAVSYDKLGNSYVTINTHTRWGLSGKLTNYTILDPVKYHFWKHYLNNPLYRRNKNILLSKFLLILSEEIQSRGESPELQKISPRQMNERLIKQIDETFH